MDNPIKSFMPYNPVAKLTPTNPVETAEKIYLAMVPFMGLYHGNYEANEGFIKNSYDTVKEQQEAFMETVISSVEKNRPEMLFDLPNMMTNGLSILIKMQAELMKHQLEHVQTFSSSLQKQMAASMPELPALPKAKK